MQLPDYPIIQLSNSMKLYVEPMDAVLVEVADDGRVRFDNQEPAIPTLQERRAILYAAQREMEALAELIEILGKGDGERPKSPL